MFEGGQIQKTIKKWTISQQNCPSDEKKQTLGFEKLMFIIILFSFGVFIAMVTFVYEIISYSKKIERLGANKVKINKKVQAIRNHLQMLNKINEELISLLEDSAGEITLE